MNTFEKALRNRHNAYDPDIDCKEPATPEIALNELLEEAELLGCSKEK